MKRFFYCIFSFLLFFNTVYCQFTWTRVLGGPRNDAGWSSLQTKDGNFLLVGDRTVISLLNGNYISQTYLAKFNAQGTLLWQKFYGDSVKGNFSYSATEDPYGNLFIASNWNTPRLMKTDHFGNILWQKEFAYPIDEFGGIKLIDNNTKLLIKTSNIINTLNTVGLLKLDTAGSTIWSKTYTDTSLYDSFYSSFYSTNDAYYIACRKNLIATILKVDTNGTLLWEKIFSHPGSFNTIIQISENSLIAAGFDATSGTGGMCCVKIDKNGIVDWQRIYNGDTISFATYIANAGTNKLVITGVNRDTRPILMKIDTMGNFISYLAHFYQPDDNVIYRDISMCNDSGFIISGYIELNDNGYIDCLMIKTDKTGNTIPIGIHNNQEINTANDVSIKSYPNPFNSNISINIKTLKNSNITIKLYNINGQEIFIIFSGIVNNGILNIHLSFDKLNLASGFYFIVLDLIKENSHRLYYNKLIYLK